MIVYVLAFYNIILKSGQCCPAVRVLDAHPDRLGSFTAAVPVVSVAVQYDHRPAVAWGGVNCSWNRKTMNWYLSLFFLKFFLIESQLFEALYDFTLIFFIFGTSFKSWTPVFPTATETSAQFLYILVSFCLEAFSKIKSVPSTSLTVSTIWLSKEKQN